MIKIYKGVFEVEEHRGDEEDWRDHPPCTPSPELWENTT